MYKKMRSKSLILKFWRDFLLGQLQFKYVPQLFQVKPKHVFVAIEERKGELSMEISRESLFRKDLFYSGR